MKQRRRAMYANVVRGTPTSSPREWSRMGGNYAGILGLVAFLTTVTRGLIHGGGTESTIKFAVINLILFAAIGLLLGRTAEWNIGDSLRSQLRSRSDDMNPLSTRTRETTGPPQPQ